MQQAIPYKSWLPLHAPSDCASPSQHGIGHASTISHAASNGSSTLKGKNVSDVALENAVVMFARGGCCMGHVVKRLLLTHGVNPLVHEVGEEEEEEAAVTAELEEKTGGGGGDGGKIQLPALFIGGKLFGGLDKVMAAHISGELVPLLKQAGALWL